MKNTFGNDVSITLFGESHGKAIGAVLDGLSAGIKIDEDFIRHQLSLRAGGSDISTARKEKDEAEIVSGVFNGYTTGAPICIIIKNENQNSSDYSENRYKARPSHADYAAFCKYHGFEDYRGGGHFSGRLTAPVVAAGAIAISALKSKGILIGTHIAECACVKDISFTNYEKDINVLSGADFPVLDSEKGEQMKAEILKAKNDADSVGGTLETVITGLPAGVGEPFFDSVESVLSHALFSMPAVKGIEFGKGFDLATLRGSEANDEFVTDGEKIKTSTNNNGGINGGITNGMPIILKTVIKPTPSIYKTQNTVDFKSKQNTEITIKGRHDPAIIHRAGVVQDSLCAIAICDLITQRYGNDYFVEKI